jgi:hypothetical protein
LNCKKGAFDPTGYSRVSVSQGSARPELVEQGWRSFLVRVDNEAGVTAELKADSPEALPVFVRSKEPPESHLSHSPVSTMKPRDVADRWLDLNIVDKPPLSPRLSGLEVEYRIIQLYSRDRGKHQATISFNVGQGTQDIGYRNDVAVLFNSLPSQDVTLNVLDEFGNATTAFFIIRDAQGRVYHSSLSGWRRILGSSSRSIALMVRNSNCRQESTALSLPAALNTWLRKKRSRLGLEPWRHSRSGSNAGSTRRA